MVMIYIKFVRDDVKDVRTHKNVMVVVIAVIAVMQALLTSVKQIIHSLFVESIKYFVEGLFFLAYIWQKLHQKIIKTCTVNLEIK